MNVAILDKEVVAAREEERLAAPDAADEIGISKKIEALKEAAQTLLKEVESLEASLIKSGAAPAADLHGEVQRFESEIIRSALKKTGGHQRRAARLLGVKVSTLNAKIKRYRIQPEEAFGLRLVSDEESVSESAS